MNEKFQIRLFIFYQDSRQSGSETCLVGLMISLLFDADEIQKHFQVIFLQILDIYFFVVQCSYAATDSDKNVFRFRLLYFGTVLVYLEATIIIRNSIFAIIPLNNKKYVEDTAKKLKYYYHFLLMPAKCKKIALTNEKLCTFCAS